MADPRFAGTEIRRRQGAESNHLAMAEHPNQGDPIAKLHAQKAAAKAGGTIAPVPSSARLNQGTPTPTTGRLPDLKGEGTRQEILKSFGD